eukprot:CAMPEP_0176311132 /NCGR_PEP_ID=MMETSP0121_2-20121125/65978_1 /TAXON_ID=160619 /ORGANISM="Kryptoperidinium foliaceum, Strain CCMP 1326" /LENGTH=59 /DNA_ID=CAMNT_0017653139 /DNA_START=85 /DNA_END=260 /DNA_ORIENTATION=+
MNSQHLQRQRIRTRKGLDQLRGRPGHPVHPHDAVAHLQLRHLRPYDAIADGMDDETRAR